MNWYKALPCLVTSLFAALLVLGLSGCAYGDKSVVVIWGHPPMVTQ